MHSSGRETKKKKALHFHSFRVVQFGPCFPGYIFISPFAFSHSSVILGDKLMRFLFYLIRESTEDGPGCCYHHETGWICPGWAAGKASLMLAGVVGICPTCMVVNLF